MLVEGFDPRYIKMCYFATLGDLAFENERYLEAKHEEWSEYIEHVSAWEIDRYLGRY